MCRLPIDRFSGSKESYRASIPFYTDNKAAVLFYLAEHGVRPSTYFLPANPTTYSSPACVLDDSLNSVPSFYALQTTASLASSSRSHVGAPVRVWSQTGVGARLHPHGSLMTFVTWLRGHCVMKNHSENPTSGVRGMSHGW